MFFSVTNETQPFGTAPISTIFKTKTGGSTSSSNLYSSESPDPLQHVQFYSVPPVCFVPVPVSHWMLNKLLFSGGVYLTISGTNLNVVKEPKMNVTWVISNGGVLIHYNTVTVRWRLRISKLCVVDLHSYSAR